MSIDGYDRLSDRLVAINSSLGLLCDMIVIGDRPKVRDSSALRQIDDASAALRRVAMVMFDAASGSLSGRNRDFFSRTAPVWRQDRDCQTRSRFDIALRFFKIACQRYQVVLAWDKAAAAQAGDSAPKARRALVERELEAVVVAINRLYLSVAMMDFTSLPQAGVRPLAPTTY